MTDKDPADAVREALDLFRNLPPMATEVTIRPFDARAILAHIADLTARVAELTSQRNEWIEANGPDGWIDELRESAKRWENLYQSAVASITQQSQAESRLAALAGAGPDAANVRLGSNSYPTDFYIIAHDESREARMVVVSRDVAGNPTVWCDPEIAGLVKALNDGGVPTVASCSGHGHRPGWIALKDGRQLVIAKDLEQAQQIGALFPTDVNGATPHAPAKAREDGPIAYTPASGFHFEHGDGVLRHVADGGDK